jgi:lipopolysaccharide transport system ATP-binding protein
MSDIAIKFENVGKLYQLGVVGTGTLSHDIRRWWLTSVRHKEDPYLKIGETNDRASKGKCDFVYALKDINLEIHQGDVVGIIGKNGAGKSTLLKLLSRVTYPTTGKIYIRGRIASLLEVGTGFHPELTGRENIYMNGCILGMRKAEIDSKLDEIVDFSGCERYLDTPVKRYSSGMMVRLGFAVAAHLDPEILVVDEVLAVGDAEFQKKAIGKMQDVSKGEGRTVLFVSHNMKSVSRLCNRGILLDNGSIRNIGRVDEIIGQYLDMTIDNKELKGQVFFNSDNTKTHQFLEAKLIDNQGDVINNPIDVDDSITLYLKFQIVKTMNIHIAFYISNTQGEIVWYNERTDEYNGYVDLEKGTYESFIVIPNPFLKPGKYTLTIGLMETAMNVNDLRQNILTFEICDRKVFRDAERAGNIYYPVKWDILKV